MSPDAVRPWQGLFNWDTGFPQNRYILMAVNPSWGNTNKPGIIDPNYGLSPYIQMWNLNVQRELARKLVLDVGYVGHKGTRLHDGELARLNQLPASALSTYGRNPQRR